MVMIFSYFWDSLFQIVIARENYADNVWTTVPASYIYFESSNASKISVVKIPIVSCQCTNTAAHLNELDDNKHIASNLHTNGRMTFCTRIARKVVSLSLPFK